MRDLPRDVLIDILSRLPAKSLGKFKSVSKYWFSLISSSHFVKFHHHQALSDTKTNHSRVFIMSTHSLHSVDFESSSCYEDIDDDDDDAKAIVSLNDPLKKESLGEKSLGSCYGLIFFVCFGECILLWNPTTQTTRVIPDPPTSFSVGTRLYGLGYDFYADDYKMVRATYSNSSKSISSEVFNLKTGSWRKVQASYIDIDNPDEIGTFSNGALHWPVRNKSDSRGFNKREVILSFDLKDEVFVTTPLPYGDGASEYSGFSCLGDLKGCLYAAYGGDQADLDIWVMKEYGVENSWSKMITLKWVKTPCDYDIWPVCFTQNGDVVIDLDSWNLARFSLAEKKFKKFKKCSTDWHFWVVYTETLVSPYG